MLFFGIIFTIIAMITAANIIESTSHQQRNKYLIEQIQLQSSFSFFESYFEPTGKDKANKPIKLHDHQGRLHICELEKSNDSIKQETTSSPPPPSSPPTPPPSVTTDSSTISTSTSTSTSNNDIASKLDFLSSVCASFNSGWWQYKWCHFEEIEQYHAEKNGVITSSQSLGKYNALETQQLNNNKAVHPSSSSTSTEEKPIYVHLFDGGDKCAGSEGSSIKRKTKVEFYCCGLSNKVNKNSATITSIIEPAMCTYTFKICTKYVCSSSNNDIGSSFVGSSISGSSRSGRSNDKSSEIGDVGEGTSSRSIQSLLLPLKQSCFRLQDGWWMYELCLNSHLRQFHVQEVKTSDRENGKSSQHELVQIHILGKNNNGGAGNRVNNGRKGEDGDEHRNIVKDGDLVAYQELYTDGELCKITGKNRESIIHFVCIGRDVTESKLMSVEETGTCQYKAVFHTPYLCQHRLFKNVESKSVILNCRQKENDKQGE